MTNHPLVSVICLCYNHERFLKQSLLSVIRQTYPNIQIIVVDDASTDQSVAGIREIIREYAHIEFLELKQNVGNCSAFNKGLAMARGEYIIDLATDDVLMPERIAHQVAFFETHDSSFGVSFTDATYIDPQGEFIRHHFEYLFKMKLLSHVPDGDVYSRVLDTYFIPSPTMMMRKNVLDELGGYDEGLAYEDFDFWVRASRKYKFGFLNERSTLIRRNHGSMSDGWYVQGDKQLHSTYLVCQKASSMNRTPEENAALVNRLKYELRQSVFSENRTEAKLFFDLLHTRQGVAVLDQILFLMAQLRLPLSGLRKWYHRLRYS